LAESRIILFPQTTRRSADPPLRKAGSFQLRKGEMREKLESDLEDSKLP
jgi:hypothetical protein